MWTFRNEPPPVFSTDSDGHRQPAKQQHGAGLWHMPESWKQEFCSLVVCCVCIDCYLDATEIGAWKKRSKIRKCKRLWAKIPPGLAPGYAAAISSRHSSAYILPRKSAPPQRDSYGGSLFPGGGKLENPQPSVSLAWLLLLQTGDSDLAWAQESRPAGEPSCFHLPVHKC